MKAKNWLDYHGFQEVCRRLQLSERARKRHGGEAAASAQAAKPAVGKTNCQKSILSRAEK